jgi:hypothetical protein
MTTFICSALHNAAEVGDVERLQSLLQKPEPEPSILEVRNLHGLQR